MRRKTVSVSIITGIVFFILKVVGVIHWTWWLILLPFYWPIPLAVAGLVLALVGIPVGDGIGAVLGKTPKKSIR